MHQTVFTKIKAMCPELEELLVFLDGNLEKSEEMEGWREVQWDRLENQVKMDVVRAGVQQCHDKGVLLGLTVRFLKRVEEVGSWPVDKEEGVVDAVNGGAWGDSGGGWY